LFFNNEGVSEGGWDPESSILSLHPGTTGPGGGIIFYRSLKGFTMTDTGEICHFLEFVQKSPARQSWASNGFEDIDINTGTVIGTGRDNTNKILMADPNAPAAKESREYNNFSDWFLPSIDELHTLYVFCYFYDYQDISLSNSTYWSSSQFDNENALAIQVNGDNASINELDKNMNCSIYSIRAFKFP